MVRLTNSLGCEVGELVGWKFDIGNLYSRRLKSWHALFPFTHWHPALLQILALPLPLYLEHAGTTGKAPHMHISPVHDALLSLPYKMAQ
jgi:hypothetical protein